MEWQPRQLCLLLAWLQALGTEWLQVIFILMQALPRCDTALDTPQMGTVSPGWPRRVLPSPASGLSQHSALPMLLTSASPLT